MNKIWKAGLASIVVLASAGCGASGNGQGFSSSPVTFHARHAVVATYSSAGSSLPVWNPPIEKVWMVGHSQALFNRSPKHPSQAVTLVHRLLKAGVRAHGAPPVTVPRQPGYVGEPFGSPTLYLKTSSGTYLLYPDYSIVAEISSSVQITSTDYRHGHVVARTTTTPTSYHLVLHAPYIVIQKQGQTGRELALKDAALFQWLANHKWIRVFQ